MHLYLVTKPGQDEDKQDKEDLDDPEYARQGAEEMAVVYYVMIHDSPSWVDIVKPQSQSPNPNPYWDWG